ncbi:alpha/beta hydrolase [Microcoleus sp. FACHB-53]|nr:alpha/beta hydrolase [Microcoleus sp. FACHB-53]MBD2128774.1 alpha/beta hydrolase [Microcoleus sp. FACHB-1]
MSLDAISIPPASGQTPTGLIVILHGWGANAQDLASLVPMLNLPNYHFLLPNAPFSHPQVAGGKMWYDLAREDYKGLTLSQELLEEWLKSLESRTGVPLESTILSGFSQGGAMTLDVGLMLPLGGLICMSGYLHRTPQDIEPPLPSVLIVHGRQDTVVPITAAQRVRDYLLSLGAPMQYKEFEMGHEIRPDVMEILREFILVNTGSAPA